MKYIKWLICIILIFFIVLSTGEIYQINISEFPIKDMVSVQLSENDDRAEFYDFIESSAQKCDVFAYVCNIDSEAVNAKTTIYCSDKDAEKLLSEKYFINAGIYNSIFLSDTVVEFKELKLCSEKESEIKIFIYGNTVTKQKFASVIEEKYEVNSKYITSENANFYSEKLFIFQVAVWCIACIFVFLLGLYETALNKRKFAIKYSLGESLKKLYGCSVLIDTVVFFVSFVIIILVLYQFTYSIFSISASIILFIFFLIINCISQISILKIDIRKAFSSNAESRGLLTFSYVFKTLCCLITVIIGVVCFGIISEAASIKEQEDFFKNYSEYSYIEMVPKDESDPRKKFNVSAVLKYKLTLECENDVLVQVAYSECKGSDGKKRDVVVCGHSSKKNILSEIPELSEDKLTENKIIIIVPEYKNYEKDINIYKSLAESKPDGSFGYYFAHDYQYDDIGIVTYKNKVSLVALNDVDSGAGKICKNPIIIFSNLDNENLATDNLYLREIGDESYVGLSDTKYSELQVYKITDNDIRAFAESNDFDIENDYFNKTNVYEKYKTTVQRYERAATIASLLFVIIMIVETIFIAVIVKMEYSVNAKEIAIKKVLGYGILQKNKQIFAMTFIVYAVVILAAVILNFIFEISDIRFILVGCALQFCIEILAMFYLVIKTDRAKIIKILKGGSL